ncbi:NTP transferase domain-containing protein [Novosphingobium profundi]|uniref:nucleotidyltransferase family protein n=1 Tax=Novosphingobium profundi TaxID=1774954 RepID=UPI001BD9DBAE|nr:nucleotidyltransferase family protein [Novosphingobium profundi]MBT0668710.1 NTP transferase domain-containing protein [Novosphingobium profundi]
MDTLLDTAPPLSALVLAGSRPGAPDPVASAEKVAHKALVPIEGTPMLARVVAALRGAGIVRIAVVANAPEVIALAQDLGCEVLPAEAGPSASVAAGFAHLGAPMLVTTADHALLESVWVTDFVADAGHDSDVAILLAKREAVEKALPGSQRTWLRMADGAWSGCNLFLLARPQALGAIETWKAVEADRKRPWRIAMRLGPGMLIRFLAGRLTMTDAIARLGAKIGIAATCVAARDGLAAVDVDKPSDLVDVRRILSARG